MKKILLTLLILIILIVAALIGLPFYFGLKAEKRYSQIVDNMSQSANLSIKKEQYERGIFNSKARISFVINNKFQQLTLTSNDYIVHGPIDIQGLKTGNLDLNTFLAKVDSDASIKIPVHTQEGKTKTIELKSAGSTDVKLDGTAHGQYIIPKYKIIKQSEDLVYNWSGLELNFIYDSNTKGLKNYFKSKSLTVTDPDTQLEISNVTGKSNTKDIDKNLQSLNGDFEMKIGSVKFNSEDDKFDMNGLIFTGYSKADQSKLHMGMKLTGKQMLINETSFGPLVYDLIIKDIDKAAWLKLQDTANSMKGNENAMEQSMQMMGILPDLVKHSPVIEIKELSLQSDIGNLEAKAKIKINGDNPEMLQNLLLIGNAIEAEASVVASKSLVEYYLDKTTAPSNLQNSIDAGQDNSVNTNISEKEFIEGEIAEKLPPKKTELDKRSKLQELLDNNYIKSDDKNYTFEATLKEGQISVNGTPVSLTPLMLQ